jgi:hypothetical protein
MVMKKIRINIKKLLKTKGIEVFYLDNNDNLEVYDMLLIVNTEKNTLRFIHVNQLTNKTKRILNKLRFNNQLNILSTNWYNAYKEMNRKFIDILLTTTDYYPDFEIVLE